MKHIALSGKRMGLLMLVLFVTATAATHSIAKESGGAEQPDFERIMRDQMLKTQYRTYNAQYQRLLERAMPYYNGRAGKFDISPLIEAYTSGERYDPFAKETIKALNDYALAAGASEKSDKASEDFRSLLEWHLPNYTILKSAMPLVRENPALGDINFLEWINKLVTERILLQSRNLMERYYQANSIEEPDLILRTLSNDPKNTEVFLGNGKQCYHVHSIENSQPNPEKIYINVTTMMTHVQDNYEVESPYCVYPFVIPDAPRR